MVKKSTYMKNDIFHIIRNYKSWLILIMIFLIYIPVILFDFGIHNDYSIRLDSNLNLKSIFTSEHHPEYKALHSLGRPINAFFQNFQYYLISDFDHLKIARFFSLSLFIIGSLINYLFLIKLKIDKFNAFFFSLIQLFVPSTQLFILWTSNIIPGSIVHVLGLLFGFVATQIYVSNEKIISNKLVLLSFVLVLGSIFLFLIYPPNATSILIPLASVILTRSYIINKTQIKKFILILFLICLGFVLGALYVKFLNDFFYGLLFGDETRPYSYQMSIIEFKAIFWRSLLVADIILPSLFNPLQTFSGPEFDKIFGIIFCLLILNYFLLNSFSKAILVILTMICLIVFSVGTHLITKDLAIGVRNIHPTFIICSLCFWKLCIDLISCITKKFKFKNRFTQMKITFYAIFCILTILPTSLNIFQSSFNASLEYYFVKRSLLYNFNHKNKNIYVYLSKTPGKTIIGNFLNPHINGNFIRNLPNNFNQMALNYSIMEGIINLNLKDIGYSPKDYKIIVNPKKFHIKENVIDFNKFILKKSDFN